MKTIASFKHRLMLVLIFSFVIILVIQNPVVRSTAHHLIQKQKESIREFRNQLRNGIWQIKNHPYFRG